MERDAKLEIAGQVVKHGVQGGLMGAAASVVSGIGVGTVTTTTPITVLWGLVTVGTATVTSPVWIPSVIVGAAVGGAVAAGAAGAAVAYRQIKAIDTEWEMICNGDKRR